MYLNSIEYCSTLAVVEVVMKDRSRKLGQIIIALNRAEQRLLLKVNQTLAPAGLNFSRLSILSQFISQPNRSQTVSSLVAATGMNQPTTTKVVASLVEQEWLLSEADSADGRSKALRITAEGMRETIKAINMLSGMLADAFGELDDDEVDQLLAALSELNGRLNL